MYTENYGSDYDNSYDDRNRRRGFPLKDFILKLILIIIFVLLLMWLIPWPNNDTLTARIFNQNIQEMKDASLLYFTAERLPKEVGDKKTLTLQEMLDLKLLLPFVDKNGDSCDTNASYVTIEKLETEYVLKVFLKCGDQEDYILVHVGCYEYCTTYLCETKDPAKDKPIFRPGTPSKPKPKPTPQKPINPKPDKPGPKPEKPTPEKPDPKPDPEKPDPKPPTPEKPDPKPDPEKPDPKPPTPTQNYVYEYKKEVAAYCAGWGEWQTKNLKNGYKTPESSLGYQAEYLGEFRVQIGHTETTAYVNYYKPVQVDTVPYKVCSNYTYESINNTTYRITSNWKQTNTLYGQTTIPAPTATKRYVPIRLRYDICLSECTSRPVFDLKVEERTVVRTTSTESQVSGCGTWTTKYLPVVVNRMYTEKLTHIEPKMASVRRYRERVCTSPVAKSTSIKWSNYGDNSLLSNGYYYTGNKKKA